MKDFDHDFYDPLGSGVDLDEFFRREVSSLSESECQLYEVRMLQLFCKKVYAGEHPPAWLMDDLANTFMTVLAGSTWQDEIALPWIPATPDRTRAQQRQLDIYCAIRNRKRRYPDEKSADMVGVISSEFNCSIKTVEAAYTAWNREKSAAHAHAENDRKDNLNSGTET